MLTIRQHLGILFLKSRFKSVNSVLNSLPNVLCINSAVLSIFSFLWYVYGSLIQKKCACYGKLTSGPRNNKYTKYSLIDLRD